MSDRIEFHFGGKTFVVPVEYSATGADRIVPLLGELAEAMYDSATCAFRRSNGERAHGAGLDLAFAERQAAGNFARAWARVIYFMGLDKN